MSETLTMAKALNRGLRRALQADPKVLLELRRRDRQIAPIAIRAGRWV